MSIFVCIYAYTPCVCLVLLETKRGYYILWYWSYRQLSAAMLELGPVVV